jgi:DNA-binding response OmpR family regulator
MTKILIVDDDLALADVLAFTLRRAGFTVALAHDGRNALERYAAEQPDLIILDWTLPYLDGREVCARLRAESEVPIIMLTVRNTDEDVVAALEAGADEYVTKPFSPRQLVARVRAVLRRAVKDSHEALCAGPLALDVERREVHWQDGPPVRLTRLETRLLQALLQNADHVLSNESLIARIWGPEGATNDMLKQLVYRLRNKLEPADDTPTLIETIPSTGYVLNTPPTNRQ